MLTRTLAVAQAPGVGRVELCAEPAVSSPDWQSVTLPAALDYSAQGEGDLGERMARGSERLLARGEALILMGIDCVQMSPALLRQNGSRLSYYETGRQCHNPGSVVRASLFGVAHGAN